MPPTVPGIRQIPESGPAEPLRRAQESAFLTSSPDDFDPHRDLESPNLRTWVEATGSPVRTVDAERRCARGPGASQAPAKCQPFTFTHVSIEEGLLTILQVRKRSPSPKFSSQLKASLPPRGCDATPPPRVAEPPVIPSHGTGPQHLKLFEIILFGSVSVPTVTLTILFLTTTPAASSKPSAQSTGTE